MEFYWQGGGCKSPLRPVCWKATKLPGLWELTYTCKVKNRWKSQTERDEWMKMISGDNQGIKKYNMAVDRGLELIGIAHV